MGWPAERAHVRACAQGWGRRAWAGVRVEAYARARHAARLPARGVRRALLRRALHHTVRARTACAQGAAAVPVRPPCPRDWLRRARVCPRGAEGRGAHTHLSAHGEDEELHAAMARLFQQLPHRAQRHVRGLLPRRILRLDARERDRGTVELGRGRERVDVAALELRFGLAAVGPRGRHRVDDMLRRQAKRARRLRLADGTLAEARTGLLHLRAGGCKDLPGDAGPLVEVLVIAVDDGVHLERRQVALPQRQAEVELLVHDEWSRRRLVEKRPGECVVIARRCDFAPALRAIGLHDFDTVHVQLRAADGRAHERLAAWGQITVCARALTVQSHQPRGGSAARLWESQ